MPQVKIIAKNFMDMVASLPAMKLDKLYDNAFICEAILRSLPPLAKKYVLQMLYIDEPVLATSIHEWVLADGESKHTVAVDRLVQLRVFIETVDRKKGTTYRLNTKFQINLQKHIVHGHFAQDVLILEVLFYSDTNGLPLNSIRSGVLPREPMPSTITVRLPSLEDLEAYAAEQWELMDTNAQLWYIIREYITNSEERGVDTADLISFLLELSFHVTGEAYNMNTLTDIQRNVIKDLADLGLVKLQQGRKESWFIPTKLATNLSISLSDLSSRKQGFVVVETNFRVYAYSSSKLLCEILRLFSRVEYQLPNLIVAAITKESLYNAFENGIMAEQIITFLQQNAHPRVAERIPSVPENVTDQIRLWESDMNRVEMTPASLFDEFPSRDVFEAACDFAREYGGVLWEDSKKMRLVVKAEILGQIREFLRR
ncbi:general transcription and DNA repair factor IIH subunit TFB2-like isoform X3 [Rhododendron vialii]|uniref:general transcription and DNA repair factor IIH subunit TFB2-like isoform X3 n=1 Tax=Rhododendron vialii TaxID=182163 RepID=UPI00265F4A14|nr:general transcription and DNA repair factor IIH subunit TFB2-like isoform X3 [Rhododendron vialii]